jgi:hypothetical protein
VWQNNIIISSIKSTSGNYQRFLETLIIFIEMQQLTHTIIIIIAITVALKFYLADFSKTATGARILFLLVSVICPFMIISSRIM